MKKKSKSWQWICKHYWTAVVKNALLHMIPLMQLWKQNKLQEKNILAFHSALDGFENESLHCCSLCFASMIQVHTQLYAYINKNGISDNTKGSGFYFSFAVFSFHICSCCGTNRMWWKLDRENLRNIEETMGLPLLPKKKSTHYSLALS